MKSIEREHPEYIAKKTMWERYRDFYTGGEQFKNHAGNYLIRRQKEPADVYWERLDRVFYENYAGSIIDWYAATLFRREPIISVEGSNEAGRTFFNEFTETRRTYATYLRMFTPCEKDSLLNLKPQPLQ